MRLNISIPDKLVEEFDKIIGLVPRSAAIQDLMRQKIEVVNNARLNTIEDLMKASPEPLSSDGIKLKNLAEITMKAEDVLYPTDPTPSSAGTPNIEGGQLGEQSIPRSTTTAISKKRCKNCDQFRFTHPHTFIYEYDRITDELCDGCWTQAKREGSARE